MTFSVLQGSVHIILFLSTRVWIDTLDTTYIMKVLVDERLMNLKYLVIQRNHLEEGYGLPQTGKYKFTYLWLGELFRSSVV